MKAFFANNVHSAINSNHIHHAHLVGQVVVIDCNRKQQTVRIDLYRKGEKSYYCGLWVRGGVDEQDIIDVTGSGKANSRFGAIYAALDGAGISFDRPLRERGRNCDWQVWGALEYVFTAIAEAAGATNCYVHHCMRAN